MTGREVREFETFAQVLGEERCRERQEREGGARADGRVGPDGISAALLAFTQEHNARWAAQQGPGAK